jgi:argininosuccinate lyase
MQVAQPVTFGHHLLAWCEMIHRDEIRLLNNRESINIMPLGSAALSGTSLKINRSMVAKALGFKSVTRILWMQLVIETLYVILLM